MGNIRKGKIKMAQEKRYTNEELILRDHLAFDRTLMALARTFLAFARTTLGLLASGAGLVILQKDLKLIFLGYFLIAFAAGVLIYGIWYCRNIKKRLDMVK